MSNEYHINITALYFHERTNGISQINSYLDEYFMAFVNDIYSICMLLCFKISNGVELKYNILLVTSKLTYLVKKIKRYRMNNMKIHGVFHDR